MSDSINHIRSNGFAAVDFDQHIHYYYQLLSLLSGIRWHFVPRHG